MVLLMDKRDEKAEKQNAASTEELLRLLKESQSLESYYEQVGDNLPPVGTPEYLKQLLTEHKLSKHDVIERANLERSSGYQIFSGQRNPRRDTVLRIALTMKLSLPETQRLLKISQRGELYPKNRRDAAIIYCIHHRLNLIDTDLLLEGIGESLLK